MVCYWIIFRIIIEKSPLVVLHKACKSNDSFSLGQRPGKLVTFQADMFGLQLRKSSHSCQIEFQQIYQIDWHKLK